MLAQALESGNFEDLADPRLERNYNEAEMFRMIEAGAACVRHSAGRRPRMGQVHNTQNDVQLSHICFLLQRELTILFFYFSFSFHSQVVRALDSVDDMSDLSNGMRPGQSEVFNSAQQSAQIRMFRRMAFGSQDYSTEFFDQSHSSWGTREHQRDQTRNNWMSREQGNQSTVISMNNSGSWNSRGQT